MATNKWRAIFGLKAMINAAKTIAMTGVDLYNNPQHSAKAKQELQQFLGPGFQYKSMIGDRMPALDFRKRKK